MTGSVSSGWILVPTPALKDLTNKHKPLPRSRSRVDSRSLSGQNPRQPLRKCASVCALSAIPFPTTDDDKDSSFTPHSPRLRRQRSSARLNVTFQQPPFNPDNIVQLPNGNLTIGKRLRPRLNSSSTPTTRKKTKHKHTKSVMVNLRWLLVVYRSIVAARDSRASSCPDLELDASESMVLVRLRDYLEGMGMQVVVEQDLVGAAERVVYEHEQEQEEQIVQQAEVQQTEVQHTSTVDMDLMFDIEDGNDDPIVPVPTVYDLPRSPPVEPQPAPEPAKKRKRPLPAIMPLPSLVATLILRHRDGTRDRSRLSVNRSESPLGRFVIGVDEQ